MDDNRYLPEEADPPHITIDRHLIVGDTQFLITASGTGGRRIDLAVVACDREGRVVSEISGGISPTDLPSVADVVSATLAGLVALHTVTPTRAGRRLNHGARWTDEDDARLIERHRQGATQRELMDEFGRSRGGIRARLIHLGELTEDGRPAD
ncbi:MAG TPA: hypothetical protein VFH03_20760 [Actinoplanes sp.]|nr:hypothetical protein [Actinoplanes sp.]